MRIDLARLLLIDLIIAVPSALLAWAISRNSAVRRTVAKIVFYSMVCLVLALATVGVVWGGAVLIQNVQHEIAKRALGQKMRLAFNQATLDEARKAGYSDAEIYSYLAARDPRFSEAQQHGYTLDEVAKIATTPTKRFDPATATLVKTSKASPPYDVLLANLPNKGPVTVEIPGHGIAEFPAGMSDDEIAAVIKKKFFSGEPPYGFVPDKYLAQTAPGKVESPDLKKITLFDVTAYVTADSRGYSFHGKVRNDLPHSVREVDVKTSFYDANGKLIESRTFLIRGVSIDQRDRNFGLATDTLSPGFAVSFDEWVHLSFLSKISTYRIEVTEAHYTP